MSPFLNINDICWDIINIVCFLNYLLCRINHYSQNLLDKLELDADEIVNMKMKQNEAKYPVDKAKGNAAKYTEL